MRESAGCRAAASSSRSRRALTIRDRNGEVSRSHLTVGCSGYDQADCNATIIRVVGELINEGCREYVSFDYYDNAGGSGRFDDDTGTVTGTPGEVHVNNCVLTRMIALLARPDPVVVRGVNVEGSVSRELLAYLYREVPKNDRLPVGGDDFGGVVSAFRTAVSETLGACMTVTTTGESVLPDIPECAAIAASGDPIGAASALTDRLNAGLDALGAWSTRVPVGDLSSLVRPSLVELTAPGDGSDPGGIYVFHVEPVTREIVYAVVTDPLMGTIDGPPRRLADRLGEPLGVLATLEPVSVFADGGELVLAYTALASAQIGIVRRDAAGTWSLVTPSPVPAPSADDSVAVAFVGGREFVAFTDSSAPTVIHSFFQGDATVDTVAMGVSARAGRGLTFEAIEGTADVFLAYSAFNVTRVAEEVFIRVVNPAGEMTDATNLPRMPSWSDSSGPIFALETPPRVVSCTVAAECGPSYVCAASTCRHAACATDPDCASGGTCERGLCRVFDRAIVASAASFDRSLALVLAPQTVDLPARLTVVSSFEAPALDIGPATTVVPLDSADPRQFDDFGASRQVRVPTYFTRGYDAIRVLEPSVGAVTLIVGVGDSVADPFTMGMTFRREE